MVERWPGEPVEEQRRAGATDKLAERETEEAQADEPAGARPGLGLEVGADATGQQEPSGTRVLVDGSLDRPEYRRHRLPLVEQQRLGLPTQGGVGIGAEGRRLGLTIEPNDRRGVPARGRRLAGGAWASDEKCRKLGEQLR